ncbi:MAG TPA: hypothetical protein VGM62_04460 [Chthoniobacterales bacterium]|jgi:hypothetical protein
MSANDVVIKNRSENNSEELTRLLELELIQKRAQWQQVSARNKNLRSISLVFLAVVFLGGMAAFFFMYMNASERPQRSATALENGNH